MRAPTTLLACLLLSACAARRSSAGAARSGREPLDCFTRLKVGAGVRVSVRPGACAITRQPGADSDALIATVEAGALALSLREGASSMIDVELEARGLEAIDATEGAEVAAVVERTRFFEATASSGAALVISQLDAEAVLIEASTGATTSADGSAAALTVVASGGGTVRARSLVAARLEVDASGSAVIEAQVTEEVRGQLATGASLTVKGAPRVGALSTSDGAEATFQR